MNTAIEQIAAAARAGARIERCFEEFGRKLGDLMQCLAAARCASRSTASGKLTPSVSMRKSKMLPFLPEEKSPR